MLPTMSPDTVASQAGVPFLPDDQLAARLRAVETELRDRGLPRLAAEVAVVVRILDPEPAR
jgi:hypothetical protein